MTRGDVVKLTPGYLALCPPSTVEQRNRRGTVEAVKWVQSWDVWDVEAVKVDGRWWPAPMWEVTE